ncbi:MAG: hypothetical protein D6677_01810 [Calditrichaeota bacterium]|nr:MAG: hypothetical protein D6677_01810 [Calditrichota bacterium]
MRLAKRERKLLYALGLVVVVLIGDVIINSDDYGWVTGRMTKKATQKTVQKKETPTQAQDASEEVYKASLISWGRDPFFDANNVPKKTVKKIVKRQVLLNLKAISVAESGSVAMINDEVLMEGDTIAGYTVARISPKEVVLTKGAQKRVLKLQ